MTGSQTSDEIQGSSGHRAYVIAFFSVILVLFAGIGSVGYILDPYGHRATQPALDRDAPEFLRNYTLWRVINFDRWRAAESGAYTVILGDSTANQIDPAAVSKATGQPAFNLSVNGMPLQGTLVLMEDIAAGPGSPTVFLSLPFRRVVPDDEHDVRRSLKMARQPWTHLTTYEHFHAVLFEIAGLKFPQVVAVPMDGRSLRNFVETSVAHQSEAAWPKADLERLATLEAKIVQKGGKVVFVRMPEHSAVRASYASPRLAQRYQRYRQFLDSRCLIDLNDGRLADAAFIDPLHVTLSNYPKNVAALVSDGIAQAPCAKATGK